MQKIECRITVFFEEPFWIGVFEVIASDKMSVSKITFGAEPKDFQIYEFILENFYALEFSLPVKADGKRIKANPKRMQRAVKKQVKSKGIGTKSMEALKLHHDEIKNIRKKKTKEQKEKEKQERFMRWKQKQKNKHRGK